MRVALVGLVLAACVFVVGCNDEEPTVEVVASATPDATDTPAATPSPAATATATVEPTRTLIPTPDVSIEPVFFFSRGGDLPLIRFAARLTNNSDRAVTGVEIEWTALDADGVIVGGFAAAPRSVPANSSNYYVGGAGSVNLRGEPASVDFQIVSPGRFVDSLTAATFTVSDVTVSQPQFGDFFTVGGIATGDADVAAADLVFSAIGYDAEGNIVAVGFDTIPTGLPSTIPAGSSFRVTVDTIGASGAPVAAELFVEER